MEVLGRGMLWKRRNKGNMFWRQMSQFSTPCNTGDMCDPHVVFWAKFPGPCICQLPTAFIAKPPAKFGKWQNN